MKEKELLPCPFCGEKAKLAPSNEYDGEKRVVCTNDDCGADMEPSYYFCAEDLWNKRKNEK
jgi:Restriction alleviation protein Lar